MNSADTARLSRIAERAVSEAGFLPHPSPAALAEAQAAPDAPPRLEGARDLTGLPWSSIDNPESRDLDQIEAVEEVDGGVKLYVGVAAVAASVADRGEVEAYAAHNTTSVYTGVRVFPMLPERYSYGLTSLLPGVERPAVVVESSISPDGAATSFSVYPARVFNRAQLAYPEVSAWLDGAAAPPPALKNSPDLQRQLRLQDALAKTLGERRRRLGALDVDTHEIKVVLDESGDFRGLSTHKQDRAGAIIEELMVASNESLARELDRRGLPSIRRVVKQPERWSKIVAYAAGLGTQLPDNPDSGALARFAQEMRRRHPERFAEISVSLVKLIGRGEYEAHLPGDAETGHFGLAADAYAHSTAPNRRYSDLVAQRIALGLKRYSMDELAAIAARCTERGTRAKKVERSVRKSAAALLLSHQVGRVFDGIVTGADRGVYAQILSDHIEGRIVRGERGLRVGDRVRLKLVEVSVERGWIDFAAA